MSWLHDLKMWASLGQFWGERADLYRDIAASIKGHELLRDFVEGELIISLSPKTLDKVRAKGLMHMRAVIESGGFSLADVLIATMPNKDHMALGVLRNSPDQVDALLNLAKNVDDQKAMSRMVMVSLVSPLVLIPVGFVFAYVLATVSIPEFVKAAPPEIWTGFNLVVRVTAEAFATVGLWVFAGIVAFSMWLLTWALPNLTSQWRYRAESATGTQRWIWNLFFPFRPVLQMYRDIQGTRFLSDLAYLLKSGMLLQEALVTMAQDATPWMRKHLIAIITYLHSHPGDHIGAFGQGVLSQFLAGRLHSAVRRDGGQFAHVLMGIGSKGLDEARESLRRSATRFSAILLVTTLSVIVFFYGGQAVIIKSIEEANSPAAVMRREAKRQREQQLQMDAAAKAGAAKEQPPGAKP